MSILLALKILGLVIGAVASLREISRKKTGAKEARTSTALVLVFLGFGTAIVAELIDASHKEKAAQEALKRNNDLLAQLQRTLHPLFPLRVSVAFTAPLTSAPMNALRSRLETKFKDEQSRNKEVPFVWLHPPGEPLFPRCDLEPMAYRVLNSELNSVVKLYARDKTENLRFDSPDLKFHISPVLRLNPQGGGVVLTRTGGLPAKWLDSRDYYFNPASGLNIDDGPSQISFSDAASSGEIVSADDLIGSTVDVDVFFEIGECGRDETLPEKNTIKFTSITIMLPGNQRLSLDHSEFRELQISEEAGRYRFTFPATKDEFAKLLKRYEE